jgi:chromosome partitioning protein
MRTIAIGNPKGGSAKTTTTVNLGAAIAAQGWRVLVIDIDPQGAASSWLGATDADRNLYRAISGGVDLAELVHETTAPGVQVIPSSPMLIAISSRQEAALAIGFTRAMDRLPPTWDVVLIDCPPTLGYLAVAPLAVSNGVFIPVVAHALALAGLTNMVALTERVRERMNPGLEIVGILGCRMNGTAHSRRVVEQIRESYPDLLLGTQVRESIRLAEAPEFRVPISAYAPGGTADADYRSVAHELMERLEGPVPPPVPAVPERL